MTLRLVPLAAAMLLAGCGGGGGDEDEQPVRDAAVAFYTSKDPAVCSSPAARAFIKKTLTSSGPAGIRKAIRSCERNRRAGRVPDRADIEVLDVAIDGRTATVHVGIGPAGADRSCAALGLEKLSGPWRVGSIDAVDCARVPS